jgi:hypothetical protein
MSPAARATSPLLPARVRFALGEPFLRGGALTLRAAIDDAEHDLALLEQLVRPLALTDAFQSVHSPEREPMTARESCRPALPFALHEC